MNEENFIWAMRLYSDIDEYHCQTGEAIWTARLCRLFHDLPEIRKSVIHCGLCQRYANPRKRRRAEVWQKHPTLPGFAPPYQLHGGCYPGLRKVQYLLDRLEYDMIMISRRLERIPDERNHRGWDLAWRIYP